MKLLLAGESWTTHTIHIKGFDTFTTSRYEEGASWMQDAVRSNGHELDYIPGQYVAERFPDSIDLLKQYDAIAISDVGANTFYLSDDTFIRSIKKADRLELIRKYVESGGGFVMIGGYMTFQGIDGKARYHNTPVETCLPVELLSVDDRVELPEGIFPETILPEHSILQGIPTQWPHFLGYNQLIAKSQARVVMKAGNDPFLSVMDYGLGRSAAFASDCSPHWGPPEFLKWEYYSTFWNQLFEWLAKKR
jgi:uncharacterized membrane protein